MFNLRILSYATASTDDSVYIIGGKTSGRLPRDSRTATIAQFIDGNWNNVGQLAQARSGIRAITLESTTLIVGGTPTNRAVNQYLHDR